MRGIILKNHKILTICLGAFLLANCGGNKANTTANNTSANNSPANNTANKPANAPVNATSPNAANQTKPATAGIEGDWESVKYNVKGKAFTQMFITIKQSGETVSGTYSVIDYIGEEPQVEDGNQTPFTGTFKDGAASIKFDQTATVPGYEENVKYKEPEDGKPSTATMNLSGDTIQWKLGTNNKGEASIELPKDLKLNRFDPDKK